MKPAIQTALLALSCVAGGALLAFALSSMIATLGGAALMPMGASAFTASGALMGLLLAGMSANRMDDPSVS